jgi:hypothetical protein
MNWIVFAFSDWSNKIINEYPYISYQNIKMQITQDYFDYRCNKGRDKCNDYILYEPEPYDILSKLEILICIT